MTTPVWPVCLLTPRDISASPSGTAAIFGGRTLSGAARAAQWSAGGLWRVAYESIYVSTREQVLAAQALDAILDGGATPIIIPRMPGRQSPDAPGVAVPHSDGTFFDDGTGYVGEGDEAQAHASALMGATTIVIRRPVEAPMLIGGEDFSVMVPESENLIAGPRLHRIARILNIALVGDFRVYTIEIRTPLRGDLAADAAVNFRNPACLMRLANYADFVLMLRRHRSGTFDALFIEV